MVKDFTDVETKGSITTLLKEIRTISLQIETNTSIYDTLDEANSMYHAYKQENGESNARHFRNFKSIVSVIEHLGGTILSDGSLIKVEKERDDKNGLSVKTNTEYKLIVKEKMLGVAFLKRSDQKRYGKLMTSIRDQHLFKKDVYPKLVYDAYELLENHSSTKVVRPKDEGGRFGRGRGRNSKFIGGRGGRGGRGYVSEM